LPKRAVSRGMAGGLGFDGAETLVLPPLDLALMAATLRGAGFDVDLIDADPLRLDDADVYARLDGRPYAAIVASVSLPTLEADAAFLAGLRARHLEAHVYAKTLVREPRVLEELLRKRGADLVLHGEPEMSIAAIIAGELRDVVEHHGIRKIYFRDATFTLDQKRTARLCALICEAGWRLEWMCETRVDCLGDALLEEMAAAGCVGILIGVETGDEAVMHL